MDFISFLTQKSNFGKKKVSDLQITERYLFQCGIHLLPFHIAEKNSNEQKVLRLSLI